MKMSGLISPVYVLTVVCYVALQPIAVSAEIILSMNNDSRTVQLLSYPSTFGAKLPQNGLKGVIVNVEPIDACTEVKPIPNNNQTTLPYIALIRRNGCDFDVKVLNAQTKHYIAAIVYNVDSNAVLPMSAGKHGNEVSISSVFVGEDSGLLLAKNNYTTGSTVVIYAHFTFPMHLYLPFVTIVGFCVLLTIIFMIAKFLRDRRKLRRSRLSREHLKKLPIRKFRKGDNYDVCAICLDEYEEGAKLRILPCNHAFHCPCIDPWLTNNKRTCPVCKRKVLPNDVEDDSSDSDDSEISSENTPLLFGNRGSNYGRQPPSDNDPLEGTSSHYSAAEDEEGTAGTSISDSTLTISLEVESDEDSTNSYEMQKKPETADTEENEGNAEGEGRSS
ncbi:E3 ubiquitin-protein ligase RNF13-like isoform X2 [Anneissia japonica]|uniref:E3 ubiquitin-protein ligase RNF13-like isoform X2 n=1 Tax=Anneissia japonica TaxID=1529436 RepID=UPI00142568EA|nr:E3 ubiquitin-protein ligase RNF13-like isoform X2 [Anneissia japonica]